MKFKFQTVPGNEIKPMPGVYLIANLSNGKGYIGISKNIERRVKYHFSGRGSKVLGNAIKKHGLENFLVTPLFYSLDGADFLPEIEAALILDYGTVENGYNIQEASGYAGIYGPKFCEILKRVFNEPEMKEKRRKATIASQTPEVVEKRAAALREIFSTAGYKERKSAASKLMQNDDLRKKKSASLRKTMSTEEYKAKRSAASKAMQTEELKAKKIASLNAAYQNPEYKEKIAAARIGRIWITDGLSTKCIHPTGDIPEGWRKGRKPRPTY